MLFGRLVFEAAQLAIPKAADSTQLTEQQTALASWSIKKVYVHSSSIGAADAVIEPDRILPRLGIAAGDLADAAASRARAVECTALAKCFGSRRQRDGRPLAKPFFAGLSESSPDRRPGAARR